MTPLEILQLIGAAGTAIAAFGKAVDTIHKVIAEHRAEGKGMDENLSPAHQAKADPAIAQIRAAAPSNDQAAFVGR